MNYTNYITNGQMNEQTAAYAMCQILQTLVAGFPSEIGQVVNLPVDVETAIAANLAPMLENFGCPRDYLDSD